jgi:hypothetical protein
MFESSWNLEATTCRACELHSIDAAKISNAGAHAGPLGIH